MFRCSDEGEGVGSSEMKTIRTNRARKLFLETLAKSCNVAESCRRANISRSAAYAWQLDDDDFAKAWADAVDEAVDKLEQKAWDRATDDGSDRIGPNACGARMRGTSHCGVVAEEPRAGRSGPR
jgi:hypothetical protein